MMGRDMARNLSKMRRRAGEGWLDRLTRRHAGSHAMTSETVNARPGYMQQALEQAESDLELYAGDIESLIHRLGADLASLNITGD